MCGCADLAHSGHREAQRAAEIFQNLQPNESAHLHIRTFFLFLLLAYL
jgi:hypothetical protein